jgi:hypothetical protein
LQALQVEFSARQMMATVGAISAVDFSRRVATFGRWQSIPTVTPLQGLLVAQYSAVCRARRPSQRQLQRRHPHLRVHRGQRPLPGPHLRRGHGPHQHRVRSLGSARVSRVGEAVSGSRTFLLHSTKGSQKCVLARRRCNGREATAKLSNQHARRVHYPRHEQILTAVCIPG